MSSRTAPTLSRRALLRLAGAAAALVAWRGGAARAAALEPPETAGRWSEPLLGPQPVIGVHAALLHTGQVLLVEGRTAYLWDPVNGRSERVDPPHDLFCCGHALLADGDVLFVGGFLGTEENQGPPWNYTFSSAVAPGAPRWRRQPDSRRGRWYPTVTLLPDGRCLITGGTDQVKNHNDDVDIYDDGRITGHGQRNLWFYPLQHVLPDGRVLATAPDQTGTTYFVDPATMSFTETEPMGIERGYPASVLLPGGPGGSRRVLMVGGWTHGRVPHASTQVFDAGRPGDGWRPRAPMPEPRAFTNVVVLPDGGLLAVGGHNDEGPQRAALLYDPLTDSWRRMATQHHIRSYHSTALLLPDGRVLSAGDNTGPETGGAALELYSPPYLFRGARPTIVSAPDELPAGAVFPIITDPDVTRAVLMRPGCVTHSFDMSQRHVELGTTRSMGGLEARVPPPTVAPPGWYMLFVLNARGVPSVARWVRVR